MNKKEEEEIQLFLEQTIGLDWLGFLQQATRLKIIQEKLVRGTLVVCMEMVVLIFHLSFDAELQSLQDQPLLQSSNALQCNNPPSQICISCSK